MRILVLSFYFEPDLCAGSFRNVALVRSLASQLEKNGEVDVITTMPNRYQSFSINASQCEDKGNVRIRRIPLPSHKSGMTDQVRAFTSYARGVLRTIRNQKYDLVFASSSRLMTAALGAFIARRQSIPLYLDIRDIFTETMGDVLPQSPARLILPVLRFVERLTIRQADRVNLVSPAFKEHFRKIAPSKSFRFFTNGIDQINEDGCPKLQGHHTQYKEILYAGNIGEGQGLHRIVPEVARRLGPSWRFRIIGDGGRRAMLEEAVVDLENVIIEPPIPRCQLVERYRMSEVLFLHLNDYPAFKKVLPSKLFEYAASGKPIIAGVKGQAATFIKDNIENVAIFSPCDSEGFFEAFSKLELADTPRPDFLERYQRSQISEEMVVDMLNLLLPFNRRELNSAS